MTRRRTIGGAAAILLAVGMIGLGGGTATARPDAPNCTTDVSGNEASAQCFDGTGNFQVVAYCAPDGTTSVSGDWATNRGGTSTASCPTGIWDTAVQQQ